jgi:hypothetical protein
VCAVLGEMAGIRPRAKRKAAKRRARR